MKVTGAKVYLVTIDRLHPVLVEVATDEGITGVGEAAVAYGIGGTAAAGMIRDLVQAMVLGRNPFRIEELWSDMYDHSFWAKGGGSIVFAGMSAIEQALWDIKGKALGIPVYEFLGGKCRDHVRTYGNGWSYASHTPDEYAKAAERVVRDGYTALKCYPFGDAAARRRHRACVATLRRSRLRRSRRREGEGSSPRRRPGHRHIG
jgi:galactonate dehydratase